MALPPRWLLNLGIVALARQASLRGHKSVLGIACLARKKQIEDNNENHYQ
jgi:hypothetical protein